MANPESTRTAGTVRTVRNAVRPHVLESVFTGYIAPGTVEDLNRQLADLLQKRRAVSWLVDAVDVTGFSPQIVASASRALRAFRIQGGACLFLAAPLPNVQMIARALGVAAQVRMEVFPDLASARAALEAMPAPPC